MSTLPNGIACLRDVVVTVDLIVLQSSKSPFFEADFVPTLAPSTHEVQVPVGVPDEQCLIAACRGVWAELVAT